MNSQLNTDQPEQVIAFPRFGLSPEIFTNLFPFHLVFNQDQKITQVGYVLQRLYPGLAIGSQFEHYFKIVRPAVAVKFQAIREQASSLFILESLKNEMQLKGQIVYDETLEAMLFLGSPWITDIAKLAPLQLKLRDFAIHDSIVDFLFLLQAQKNALADTRKLTDKLTSQQSEIRQALAKEKELGELKSRFVSMASHEFRTPLTTILSSTELLEHYSHKWSEEKKRTHLQRIQAAVENMTRLLDDVLLIGKAEAGKLEFNPAPVELIQFCRDLVEAVQVSASNHTIAFDTQGDCSDAVMDEKLLRHILSNLLSNGIKYSPGGGTVHLELVCEQAEAVFQIQDEGIGIPEADQVHLFDSFHRASNVGTIQGTGLGLAIVKKSVDLHGGTITVQSEVGVGTLFSVTLPLHKAQMGQ